MRFENIHKFRYMPTVFYSQTVSACGVASGRKMCVTKFCINERISRTLINFMEIYRLILAIRGSVEVIPKWKPIFQIHSIKFTAFNQSIDLKSDCSWT